VCPEGMILRSGYGQAIIALSPELEVLKSKRMNKMDSNKTANEIKFPKMLDNKRNGKVINELKDDLAKGSRLSVISAYFTIYAYADLKKELNKIDSMRFIFTEPTFIKKNKELLREYYIEHDAAKKVSGNEFEIKLRNEMKQAANHVS